MFWLDGELLGAVALFSAPLVLAAGGELVVERAGMVNIGIEGMMLAGALGGWVGNAWFGPGGGVVLGALAGMVLAGIFAVVSIVLAADQILAGTGVNLLALGLTGLLFTHLESTVNPAAVAAISPWWLVIGAPVLLGGIWLFDRFTRPGLELAAIGHNPLAAQAAGVPVRRRKLYALLFGGACAGLAGCYLSTMRFQGFTENMTGGTGFLALALVILGQWASPGILLAGLLFGFVRALAYRLNVSGVLAPSLAPLLNMLPYLLSLLALALSATRQRQPQSLGQPFPPPP